MMHCLLLVGSSADLKILKQKYSDESEVALFSITLYDQEWK